MGRRGVSRELESDDPQFEKKKKKLRGGGVMGRGGGVMGRGGGGGILHTSYIKCIVIHNG